MLRRLGRLWWALAFLALVEGYLGLCWAEHTFRPFVVTVGTSMQPVFHQGAVVLVRGTDPARLRVGEIVLFRVPLTDRRAYGYPAETLHRIVDIQAVDGRLASIQTQGDNTTPDPFRISPSDVVGVAYAQIPTVGQPLLFLRSRPGLFFLAGTAVLVLGYRWYTHWAAGAETAPAERPEELLRQIRDLLRSEGGPGAAAGDPGPPGAPGESPTPVSPRRTGRNVGQ